MRPFLTLGLICALALPALADYPQLFSVTGVAADDVLNVREAPSGTATIVGTLPPDARNIEVLDRNATRRWGQINLAEGTGWVAMRFLEPQGRSIDNYNLPVGLRCFGTEPFWSLDNTGGALRFTPMDGDGVDLVVERAQDSGIGNDLRRLLDLSGPNGRASGFVYGAQCSDGMSDRRYGIAVSFTTRADGPMLSGCCTLAP